MNVGLNTSYVLPSLTRISWNWVDDHRLFGTGVYLRARWTDFFYIYPHLYKCVAKVNVYMNLVSIFFFLSLIFFPCQGLGRASNWCIAMLCSSVAWTDSHEIWAQMLRHKVKGQELGQYDYFYLVNTVSRKLNFHQMVQGCTIIGYM